jgi:hypothetical protein
MKHFKFLLLFLAIVTQLQIAYSQDETNSFMNFKFKDIPFGKTQSEITDSFSNNVNIDLPSDIDIEEFYGFVAIRDYFSKGVYSYYGRGYSFSNKCATKQILTNYKPWNNIYEIELFYAKQYSNLNEEPVLFLVRKQMKEEYQENLTNVFNDLNASVTKELGKIPKALNSDYISSSGSKVASKIAIWDTGSTIVFLMVSENYFGFYRSAQFLYLSKVEWNLYLKSVQEFEKEKQEKNKEKTNATIDSF